MPPYGACAATWLSITSLSTAPLARTTAAAVSSHDVSMPSTVMSSLEATALFVPRQVEKPVAGTLPGAGVWRQRRGLEQAQLDIALTQQRDERQHGALTGRVGPGEKVFVVAFTEAQRRQRVVVDLRNATHGRAFEQRLSARRAQAELSVVAG